MSSPTPNYAGLIEMAYRQGRDDAAMAVLDLMCHEPCDTARCEVLAEAWNAAKGGEQE